MIEKKETLGQLVTNLVTTGVDYADAAVHEVADERLLKMVPLFEAAVAKAQRELRQDRDFYLEVHFTSPQLGQGLVDQFPMHARLTLPAPTFNQAVYLYHRATGDIELIWSIPHITGCVEIDNNLLKLDPSQRELAHFVLAFKHGTLYKNSKRINQDLENPSRLL